MMWIRLAIAIMIYIASSVGLGYLAGFWVRQHKRPGWVSGLLSAIIALLWPAILVGYTIFDARRHLSQHPSDDAPGMVVVSVIHVLAPMLFVLTLFLALAGVGIADVRYSKKYNSPC